VSRHRVEEETGFSLLWPDNVPQTQTPTDEELRWIREEIDPARAFLTGRIF
jgi:hypothetical protein